MTGNPVADGRPRYTVTHAIWSMLSVAIALIDAQACEPEETGSPVSIRLTDLRSRLAPPNGSLLNPQAVLSELQAIATEQAQLTEEQLLRRIQAIYDRATPAPAPPWHWHGPQALRELTRYDWNELMARSISDIGLRTQTANRLGRAGFRAAADVMLHSTEEIRQALAGTSRDDIIRRLNNRGLYPPSQEELESTKGTLWIQHTEGGPKPLRIARGTAGSLPLVHVPGIDGDTRLWSVCLRLLSLNIDRVDDVIDDREPIARAAYTEAITNMHRRGSRDADTRERPASNQTVKIALEPFEEFLGVVKRFVRAVS